MITLRVMDPSELLDLKHQHLRRTTAPLDGMWLFGFVPQAKHFGLFDQGALIGYCCVNAEGYLLQFMVVDEQIQRSGGIFESLMKGGFSAPGPINGAFVSTAEPGLLTLCLDWSTCHQIQAYMYQLSPGASRPEGPPDIDLETVEPGQLEEAIAFCIDTLGSPEGWLRQYLGNLINRGELLGLWRGGRLVATGECRGHAVFQTQYADLGMIVAKGERRKGLATQILRRLVKISESRGLIPICSTDLGNVGAQKAIGRAGFFPYHRILRFDSVQSE